jgi:hypothetical protein
MRGMSRVAIRPEMLRWACAQSRIDKIASGAPCPHLPAWKRGAKQPTFKQLEGFARDACTPIGLLFLIEQPRVESRKLVKGFDLGMSNGASIIATREVCE